METVLVVIHLLIVIVMAAVILLQRSEGGALGMGGGGGGGFMTSRGQANLLTRTTSILAVGFFLTSIALSIVANYNSSSTILDQLPGGSNGLQPLAPQPLTPTAPAANPTGPQIPTAE